MAQAMTDSPPGAVHELDKEPISREGDEPLSAVVAGHKVLVGVSLAFDNVSLALSLSRRQQGEQATERLVLSGVTGVVPAGTMYALMGSSGAGKTSLLDVAAMRKNTGRLGGRVLLGGVLATVPLLKRYSAYVQQDDALCGWCTIEETLLFTAAMKLKGCDAAERRSLVEDVIVKVGLQHARKTLVGSRLVRGCSGGERKRTSVALSLLGAPCILFLDEPTSGLDSATAAGMMRSLRSTCDSGITLLVTIHQPSPEVYHLFDGLLLLHRGRVCYLGPGGEAPLTFFEQQGAPYRAGFSLSEFLIETIADPTHDYAASFALSPLAERQRLAAQSPDVQLQASTSDKDIYANSALRELFLLLRYRGIVRYADPAFLFSRTVLLVILGALFASFFYGMHSDVLGIAAGASVLFLCTSTPTYLGSLFVQDLISDREVYTRELHDAYYRAMPYCLCKLLTDLPAAIAACLAFTGVLYPSVGLRPGWEHGAFFSLCMLVNILNAALVGFSLSSIIKGEVGALIILPCFATLHTLASGLLININVLPIIWRWMYTISYEQHLLSALLVDQWRGRTTDECFSLQASTLEAVASLAPAALSGAGSSIQSLAGGAKCTPIQGSSVLTLFSLGRRSRWASLGYASLSLPVFFLLFYLGVRFVRHERR